jgi:two-component system, NtrC family, response regulator AtoC
LVPSGREHGGHGDDTTTIQGSEDARAAGYSLVVIGPDATTVHALPGGGPVIIGRAAGSDIRIDDPSVSRKHARLVLGPTPLIEDLGSRNGVRVRGELIPAGGSTEIAPDEVVGVGNYSVVLQRRAPSARPLRLWSHDYFEVRVDDECTRSERFGWSFALAHVRVEGERSAAITRAGFAAALRSIDAVGSWGPGEYQILLVEADAAEVDQILTRLRAAMSAQGVAVQAAVVTYPRDGRDAATLAARARAAALGQTETSHDGAPPLVIDDRMRSLHELASRIAGSDLNVLLLGETGTGKEVLAEVIHSASPRAGSPFLRVNCAALPEPLLESELFGHERGAFTGANQAKPGLVEAAAGGTMFLDEVGELPPAIQAKFLRVLESREVRRVGGVKPRASTCASWPPPTAIWRPRSRGAGSAPISTTA